jgi:hypothetical protein
MNVFCHMFVHYHFRINDGHQRRVVVRDALECGWEEKVFGVRYLLFGISY